MVFTQYGIYAAAALAVALAITHLAGLRHGLRYGGFLCFAALALPLTLVMSRAVFCLSSLSSYEKGGFQAMLRLRDGGYSMLGALMGLSLAALLAERCLKLPGGALLDALGLGLPAGLIVARLAEPLCEMGWGYFYESPAFAFLDEATKNLGDLKGAHPVFLYEAVTAGVILLLMLLRAAIRRNGRQGDAFLTFLLLYGCTQTVWESMLNSSHMKVIHFVRINQIGAMLLAVIPLVIWSLRLRGTRSQGRILSAWALAGVCMLSGVVQEFTVQGAENPFFSIATAGAVAAGLLAAAAVCWCIFWRKSGLASLLQGGLLAAAAVGAAFLDRVTDVGMHYRIILWGIMAADMLLICRAGASLRDAAASAKR